MDSLLFEHQVMLIGCGGTGSLVARMLLPILHSTSQYYHAFSYREFDFCVKDGFHHLIFVDADKISPRNLERQFNRHYTHRVKSQVLRSEVAGLLPGSFITDAFNKYVSKDLLLLWSQQTAGRLVNDREEPGFCFRVLLCCVDNNSARHSIEQAVAEDKTNTLYLVIDAGNADAFGQVITYLSYKGNRIGNPVSHYFPEILRSNSAYTPDRNEQQVACGEEVEFFNQTYMANVMAASSVIFSLETFFRQRKIIPVIGFDLTNAKAALAYETALEVPCNADTRSSNFWIKAVGMADALGGFNTDAVIDVD